MAIISGEGFVCTTGSEDLEVSDHLEEYIVDFEIISDTLVTLYCAWEDDVLHRLGEGCSFRGQIRLKKGLKKLHLSPASKSKQYKYKIRYKEGRWKEKNDGVPYAEVLPLDDNSFQARVRQAVDAQLAAAGITHTNYSGTAYRDDDYEFDEDDTEFASNYGGGYQYDPQTEEELNARTRTAVYKRFGLDERMSTTGSEPGDDGRQVDDIGSGDGEPDDGPKPKRTRRKSKAPSEPANDNTPVDARGGD